MTGTRVSTGYQSVKLLCTRMCIGVVQTQLRQTTSNSTRCPHHQHRDGADDLTKGSVIDSLPNAAGIDSTHRIVRATLLVMLDCVPHGQIAINYDVSERSLAEYR